jgi:hypothetical protein
MAAIAVRPPPQLSRGGGPVARQRLVNCWPGLRRRGAAAVTASESFFMTALLFDCPIPAH